MQLCFCNRLTTELNCSGWVKVQRGRNLPYNHVSSNHTWFEGVKRHTDWSCLRKKWISCMALAHQRHKLNFCLSVHWIAPNLYWQGTDLCPHSTALNYSWICGITSMIVGSVEKNDGKCKFEATPQTKFWSHTYLKLRERAISVLNHKMQTSCHRHETLVFNDNN